LYTSREEYRLSDAAIHAFTTFAKTGVPLIPNTGSKEVANWPVYKTHGEPTETRQNVVFGIPMKHTVSESDTFRDDVCAVWRRIEGRRETSARAARAKMRGKTRKL
jgi:hypothetical protein